MMSLWDRDIGRSQQGWRFFYWIFLLACTLAFSGPFAGCSPEERADDGEPDLGLPRADQSGLPIADATVLQDQAAVADLASPPMMMMRPSELEQTLRETFAMGLEYQKLTCACFWSQSDFTSEEQCIEQKVSDAQAGESFGDCFIQALEAVPEGWSLESLECSNRAQATFLDCYRGAACETAALQACQSTSSESVGRCQSLSPCANRDCSAIQMRTSEALAQCCIDAGLSENCE